MGREIIKNDFSISNSCLSSRVPIIIAITASAFEEQRQAIFTAGCDDFICKPFAEDVLLEKIAYYLGVRYVYDVQSDSLPSVLEKSVELSVDDFRVMPVEWLLKLELAARALNEESVISLIKEVPDTESKLTQGLLNLVDNFRLDIILSLVQRGLGT